MKQWETETCRIKDDPVDQMETLNGNLIGILKRQKQCAGT